MRERIEGRGAYRPIVLFVLLAVAALLLASCQGSGGDSGDMEESALEETVRVSTTPENSITLEELTRRPDRFYGALVGVNGRVGRTLSPNTFTLTSAAAAADSDEAFALEAAVVAGEEGSVPDLSEGQRVRVVGEAMQFRVLDIEEELGVNLEDDLHSEFEERPAIVLGNVEVLEAGGTTEGMTGE